MIEPISQKMKDAFIKSMKNGEDMDIYTLRLGYNDGVRVTTKRFNEAVEKLKEEISKMNYMDDFISVFAKNKVLDKIKEIFGESLTK